VKEPHHDLRAESTPLSGELTAKRLELGACHHSHAYISETSSLVAPSAFA
jgi:hypothetical protein